jgi:hypothetical protein
MRSLDCLVPSADLSDMRRMLSRCEIGSRCLLRRLRPWLDVMILRVRKINVQVDGFQGVVTIPYGLAHPPHRGYRCPALILRNQGHTTIIPPVLSSVFPSRQTHHVLPSTITPSHTMRAVLQPCIQGGDGIAGGETRPTSTGNERRVDGFETDWWDLQREC